MHGRKMQPGDLQRIAAISEVNRNRFDLPFLPDLVSGNFIAKRLVESGPVIIAGAAARVTAEMYLFMDPHWESPRWRLEALKLLHEEMRVEMKEKGLTEGLAWVPPQIERAFGRRLEQLGWQRPLWTNFVRQI